ncbi:uncharacterized protein [Nicotiana sylvestris]|uniref:Uncharacterized protein LOC104238115 n=2 Tax=Nicotiana sylvestris TaxID=4096 RepID=A0A1U7XF46_NICSY|nr:PREDICTED: uncharacterized protein LOC104238115 [Nicotiana sylvestris]
MPKSYFNDFFNNIIKSHFCFVTLEEVAREYVYRSIAKKWAASRQKLWDEFKDPLKTKDEIMDNVPVGITRDQWTFFVNYRSKEETQEKIKLAVSESTVDESEISPNDAAGKVLGKEHPGRVRCLGLGATPSNTFRETNLRPGNIRIVSNNVGCSSGCQEKYNQLMNTLKAYMIMKEGSIAEQFAGIFASTPTTPRDATSGPVSPTDAKRSSSASNLCDSN